MSTAILDPLRDFGDRMSPLVVKELRQGLRTRFFTTALILFHTFIVLLLGSVLLEAPTDAVNGIFWSAAGFMLLVVLPLRGFNALNGEAADGTLDMLTLTSISSFRILQGKWVALFSQALLVAGSLLPYMVARYYFGGVEILREGVALLVLVLGCGIISSALLAFSSQTSVVLRIALALGVGFGAVPLGVFTAFLVASNEADRMLREFFALESWAQWSLVSGVILLSVYLIWFFLAMGASRIAPPSENHSTRKRVTILVVHGLLTVIGLLLAWFSIRGEQGMWAFIPLLGLTLLACMDTMSEEMPRFPMAVAGLAKRGVAGVGAGRLLHPGWASGVLFSMLLCSMAFCLMGVITIKMTFWTLTSGPLLYVHCLMMAAFVPVVVRLNQGNLFANWWAVQICMVGLGFLLSMFTAATGSRDTAFIGFLTPITTLFGVELGPHGMREEIVSIGSIMALLWLAGTLVRAARNFTSYNALEREARELAAARKPEAAS